MDLRSRETKDWRCSKCGAVMGHIIKRAHVERLRVGSNVEITGGALIKCRKCGEIKRWTMGKDGWREAISELRKRAAQKD